MLLSFEDTLGNYDLVSIVTKEMMHYSRAFKEQSTFRFKDNIEEGIPVGFYSHSECVSVRLDLFRVAVVNSLKVHELDTLENLKQ